MKELVDWRAGRQLSQEAAAKKFHVSKRQYIRWERDECVPSHPKLALIQKLAGITPDQFLRKYTPE